MGTFDLEHETSRASRHVTEERQMSEYPFGPAPQGGPQGTQANPTTQVPPAAPQPGGLLTGADREISFRPANIPKHAGHHAL